jgi:hypothetical protein
MNIGFFKRPLVHTLLTTLYCSGCVASVGLLYVLTERSSPTAFQSALTLVTATFFLGILSIYLTARSKKEVVVYLEKKKENGDAQTQGRDVFGSQLNLPAFDALLQGENAAQKVVVEICRQLEAGQGAIYVAGDKALTLLCGYALPFEKTTTTYAVGEGLIGRVGSEGQTLYIDNLPAGYITVFSGLGSASPSHLAIVPIRRENGVVGVLEIATFGPLHRNTMADLEALGAALSGILPDAEKRSN